MSEKVQIFLHFFIDIIIYLVYYNNCKEKKK